MMLLHPFHQNEFILVKGYLHANIARKGSTNPGYYVCNKCNKKFTKHGYLIDHLVYDHNILSTTFMTMASSKEKYHSRVRAIPNRYRINYLNLTSEGGDLVKIDPDVPNVCQGGELNHRNDQFNKGRAQQN